MDITEYGVIEFYGNMAGYVKQNTAYIDPMFEKDELIKYLKEEKLLKVQLQNGVYDKLIQGKAYEEPDVKCCRIYRIKPEADARIKFIGIDELERRGFGKPDPKNYSVVFDGNIGTDDLERIYTLLNDEAYPQKEASLFISDIIELYNEKERTFYYVDQFKFKQIDFVSQTIKYETNTAGTSSSDSYSGAEKRENEHKKTIFTFTM